MSRLLLGTLALIILTPRNCCLISIAVITSAWQPSPSLISLALTSRKTLELTPWRCQLQSISPSFRSVPCTPRISQPQFLYQAGRLCIVSRRMMLVRVSSRISLSALFRNSRLASISNEPPCFLLLYLYRIHSNVIVFILDFRSLVWSIVSHGCFARTRYRFDRSFSTFRCAHTSTYPSNMEGFHKARWLLVKKASINMCMKAFVSLWTLNLRE